MYVLLLVNEISGLEIPERIFGPWESQVAMEKNMQGTALRGGGGSYEISGNNNSRLIGFDLVDPEILKKMRKKEDVK